MDEELKQKLMAEWQCVAPSVCERSPLVAEALMVQMEEAARLYGGEIQNLSGLILNSVKLMLEHEVLHRQIDSYKIGGRGA